VKERSALRKQLRQILSKVEEDEEIGPLSLQVGGEHGATIPFPGAAAGLLLDLLSDLAEGRAVCLYDANVLYSAQLRDFLVRLALGETVRAQWTEQIHEEWDHFIPTPI
jgi:hypothetical protein